ncbi:MAG: hypothetical protein WB988_18110 [Candidatus Nitrosopolaris sp.]
MYNDNQIFKKEFDFNKIGGYDDTKEIVRRASNVSNMHFKNMVFACPGGPTNRICTGSLESSDLAKVRLIPS